MAGQTCYIIYLACKSASDAPLVKSLLYSIVAPPKRSAATHNRRRRRQAEAQRRKKEAETTGKQALLRRRRLFLSLLFSLPRSTRFVAIRAAHSAAMAHSAHVPQFEEVMEDLLA